MFFARFPRNRIFFISPIYVTCPALVIFLCVITRIIFYKQYKPRGSPSCSSLQSPVISSLLGPNIFFSKLLLIILNLCFFLNVRYHVLHPYKDKVIAACILIFIPLDTNWKTQDCDEDSNRHSSIFVTL